MSFEAVPENLRQAARQLGLASEQAGSVALGKSASELASALPGSTSAGSANRLSASWTDTLKTWSAQASAHSDSLNTSADEYTGNDQSASESFAKVAATMQEQAG